MAIGGDSGKWRCQAGAFLHLWILLTGFLDHCLSCHPDSRYLHACLHTFLERDFPLIQAYQAPSDIRNRGRILLEGPTLDSICKKIFELDFCFEEEALACRGLYNLEGYRRLMKGFRSIEHLLCRNDMSGLMSYLKHASCLENFRNSLPSCRGMTPPWETVWVQIFRLQVGPEVCSELFRQRDCVLRKWNISPCEEEAGIFYNQTFTTWLDAFCNAATSQTSSLILLCYSFITLRISGL